MSRPLRFLYLTTFYPPYSFGGDAVYLHRVAHALGDQGHTVDVVHCLDSYHMQHAGEPEIAYREHPNVTRHGLKSSVGVVGPLIAHQTGHALLHRSRLARIFELREWDVVHYHNISLLGPGVLFQQPRGGRAVKLYTTHEHWLVCPMSVLWKYGSRVCEKPECLKCTLKGRRPPQIWRHTGLLKRAGGEVDRFLSPSRFTAGKHAERGFPYPVDVLPYFLERSDEDWRNPGPRPVEQPYFLFVGRLEAYKGLDTLIEAWRGISEWDLLVAGTGGAEAELRARGAGNPRIRFLGSQSQKQLGALYANAVATIVPSTTYETFGIVLIESLARKTPVIARDLGALPEVVDDSGGGFNYRTNEELTAQVRRLGSEPGLRQEMSELGYGAFLKYWTREAHLECYERHINEAGRQKHGLTTECQLT